MVNYIALLTAFVLSGVAAWYSIIGLTTIFASAFWPIVIMGGSLEVAKVVATSWLYRNWSVAPVLIKYYLTAAVVVLMLITSMGTFGYLSKAHMDQAIPTGSIQDKLNLIDEKINTAKENINANRKALRQMDEAVDQIMARTSDDKGADKAVALRRSQSKERQRLVSEIEQEQAIVGKLSEERTPYSSELRKVVSEVGPIKYIAELIYGESTDDILDKAVRWVIILIVAVFDPLAIALLLAANHGLRNIKEPEFVEPDPEIDIEVPVPPPPKKVKPRNNVEPLWVRKAVKLKDKKRSGIIEIDKDSITRM
jgi:hypothetical protein